jgi:hypothetical protein
MTWLVLRLGDMLVRLERHPPAYFGAAFAFLWGVWTLGLHFVPRSFDNVTVSWGDAVVEGLVVALVGTVSVYLLYWRRGR